MLGLALGVTGKKFRKDSLFDQKLFARGEKQHAPVPANNLEQTFGI